jgi:PhzF family phenazine biosynthesis protein
MQEIVQVDAFTKVPFKGNPAAVCVMKGPASEEWMQKVALEMNLSETAFLYREGDVFGLRWFTPGAEVELCGHATLASAHLLFVDNHIPSDSTIKFKTKHSGVLTVERDGSRLLMDFPVLPVKDVEIPQGLQDALGLKILAAGTTQSSSKLIVEVDSADALRAADPDIAFISRLQYWGVCITAKGGDEYDFISRFFAPRFRVNEDPATGSAHCALVDYWSRKLNKEKFRAYQASQRGGEFFLQKKGDRCLIGGDAVITMRGQLTI